MRVYDAAHPAREPMSGTRLGAAMMPASVSTPTTVLCVRRAATVAHRRRRPGHARADDREGAAPARCASCTTAGCWPASPARPPTPSRCSSASRRKLKEYRGNLARAAVELAKDWRTDRVLRRLEALLVVADASTPFILSGTGDVIEPDDGLIGIGSGGPYALAAARALLAAHRARRRARSPSEAHADRRRHLHLHQRPASRVEEL